MVGSVGVLCGGVCRSALLECSVESSVAVLSVGLRWSALWRALLECSVEGSVGVLCSAEGSGGMFVGVLSLVLRWNALWRAP